MIPEAMRTNCMIPDTILLLLTLILILVLAPFTQVLGTILTTATQMPFFRQETNSLSQNRLAVKNLLKTQDVNHNCLEINDTSQIHHVMLDKLAKTHEEMA